MHEHEPVQAEAAVKVGEERVRDRRVAKVESCAPRVCGVNAEPERVTSDATSVDRPCDQLELVDARSEADPAAGRVLEHELGCASRAATRSERANRSFRNSLRARFHARAEVRAYMDVDERGAICLR